MQQQRHANKCQLLMSWTAMSHQLSDSLTHYTSRYIVQPPSLTPNTLLDTFTVQMTEVLAT